MEISSNTSYAERIRSAFLRAMQQENDCQSDGKPCDPAGKCGCLLEVDAWITKEMGTVNSSQASTCWQPIETAPVNVRVLVYGRNSIRFGVLDEFGNWRAMHHGPVKGKPTHWQHLPEPPNGGE